ncbi:MAG: peptidoglycan DD-metalloendopeptidase family protein [Gammaproteobacteria bacterium]|nr:peptidoglycan DD-metalloendopeptidase family protein [Gammaproteobacteria bacterium]MCW5583898.1 peptidoglycan DD-metalloendopeptidase family protein [Gammaproteobacteria bacterium]
MLIHVTWLCVTACSDTGNFAPVTDLSHIEPVPKAGIHRIVQGETLYEIAWRYGLDYRYLAALNHIKAPYTIQSNQIIYLNQHAPVPQVLVKKVKNNIGAMPTSKTDIASSLRQPEKPVASAQKMNREPNFSVSGWRWPAQGRVVSAFSAMNKGINIANHLGEPIYAVAGGKVVYSGNGLRGYGNLIIIKHNSLYLSAYAHNSRVMVKEGDWVKQGQKIAEMGNTGSERVMLHFEIRRAGKPINPISLY